MVQITYREGLDMELLLLTIIYGGINWLFLAKCVPNVKGFLFFISFVAGLFLGPIFWIVLVVIAIARKG